MAIETAALLFNGTVTFTVPTGWTTTNRIHLIGAGQAGGDGVLDAAHGGVGGAGGDYTVLENTTAWNPGDVVTVAIGAGGASGGAIGGDTFIKDAGGTIIALARGGGSGSANVGTLSNAGGAGGNSPLGHGGGGGGGAGGPNGVGGDGGTTSPAQHDLQNNTVTNDGGTGGGAANGGHPGASPATIGGYHISWTDTNYGLDFEIVGGDGGDGGNAGNLYWLSSGNAVPNIGGPMMMNQPGQWGSGGAGGPGYNGNRPYVLDNGITCPPWPVLSEAGKRVQQSWGGGSNGTTGGFGFLWGLFPNFPPTNWNTQSPNYANGRSAGPGGGGGAGGGGYAPFPEYVTAAGRIGGSYGGGGGGGGSTVTGSAVVNGIGGAGADGLIVIAYDASPPPPLRAGYAYAEVLGL